MILVLVSLINTNRALAAFEEEPITTYFDEDYEFGFTYPVDWQLAVEEISNNPDAYAVINRRIKLTPSISGNTHILIDIWVNKEGRSLSDWFMTYEAEMYRESSKIYQYPDVQIAGRPSILVEEPNDETSYGRLVALMLIGTSIVRVNYYLNDQAIYLSSFEHLLNTIHFAGSSGKSKIPSFEFITPNVFAANDLSSTCCGRTDPNDNTYYCSNPGNGNCTWWAKYQRPDIGNWWGNAKLWRDKARQEGFPVGYEACPGAIAVLQAYTQGTLDGGHVGYVTKTYYDRGLDTTNMGWTHSCSLDNNGVYRWDPIMRETNNESLTFIYPKKDGCIDYNLIDDDWNLTSGQQNINYQIDRQIQKLNQASVYQNVGYPFPQNGIVEFSFKLRNSSIQSRLVTIILENQDTNSGKIFRDFYVEPTSADKPTRKYTIWGTVNKGNANSKKLRVEIQSRDSVPNSFLVFEEITLKYYGNDAARIKTISDYANTQQGSDLSIFCDSGYCDVRPWDTFYEFIRPLVNRDKPIISGYSDGTYKPDEYITRGQAAKLIVLGMKGGDQGVLNDTSFVEKFNDVKQSDTFFKHIMYLEDKDIVSGNGAMFYPDQSVTREQLAKMIALARTGISAEGDEEYCEENPPNPGFDDVTPDSTEFYRYIACLVHEGVIDGQKIDGRKIFRPTDPVTRGEAAKFIYNGLITRTNTDKQPKDVSINDSTSSGATLPPGQTLEEKVPRTDEDDFQPSLQDGLTAPLSTNIAQATSAVRPYLFTIFDQGVNADIKLEILNSSGQPIAQTQQSAKLGAFTLRSDLDSSQTYYVRVTNTDPYAIEGTNYKLRMDSAYNPVDPAPTGYTFWIDPYFQAHCGNEEYKYVALALELLERNGTYKLSGTVTKCDGTAFSSNGSYVILRDDDELGAPIPYTIGSVEQRFSVDINPQDYTQVRRFQVRLKPDNQTNSFHTGVVRVWREDLPALTTYRYNVNLTAGCGPGNYIRMNLAPDNQNHRMSMDLTTCSGADFGSTGKYWVTVDGARIWGPFTIFANNRSSKIYLDPYGADLLNDRSTHTYKVELVSDNDPNVIKQSNPGQVNLITEERYTVLALRDGALWQDVGIWQATNATGAPGGYGFYAKNLQSGSGPWTFHLAQMPGYTIDYNVPETMRRNDANGKHVFAIDDEYRNLVVDYIKECYKLVQITNPANGGTIAVNPAPNCGTDRYQYGTNVTLTANPTGEFSFGGWGGAVSGTAQSVSLTMDRSKTIAAEFTAPCYTLTVNRSPVNGGTVSVAPEPNCTGGKYLLGTEVTLNATPAAEQAFSHWSGDAYGVASATTVTMYSNKSIAANFESLYKQGEVSCDNQIDVVDAMFILQYDIGLRSAATQCPTSENTLLVRSCDVNQDNACNSTDALFVLQCNVGLANTFCPAVAAAMTPLTIFQSQANTAVIEASLSTADTDGLLHLPLKARLATTNLGAATIEVRYDPTQLQVMGCNVNPTSVFDLAFCNAAYDHDGSGTDSVRFTVLSTAGLTGEVALNDIIFQPLGELTDEPLVDVVAPVFSETTGLPINVTVKQAADEDEPTNNAQQVFLPLINK